MRRKPDLLLVLVVVFGLGMVMTGYSQNQWQQAYDASSTERTVLGAL